MIDYTQQGIMWELVTNKIAILYNKESMEITRYRFIDGVLFERSNSNWIPVYSIPKSGMYRCIPALK